MEIEWYHVGGADPILLIFLVFRSLTPRAYSVIFREHTARWSSSSSIVTATPQLTGDQSQLEAVALKH